MMTPAVWTALSSLQIRSIRRQRLLAGMADGHRRSHLFLVGTPEAFFNSHLLAPVQCDMRPTVVPFH